MLRSFLLGKANEEAEFDDLGRPSIFVGEPYERSVQSKELIIRKRARDLNRINVQTLQVATPLLPFPLSCILDEDPPHRLRRGAKEVSSALPCGLLISSQPDPSIVHEDGRLDRLSGLFLRHFPTGHRTQLVVHESEELCGGALVTVLDPLEKEGHISHGTEPLGAGNAPNRHDLPG